MPTCNQCHPLPSTKVGRVLLPDQTSINTCFRNRNLLSIADALSTAAASRPLQAACCSLAMAACLARSLLTLFWSREEHNRVLLSPGHPGVAAPLSLNPVWFGFAAEPWAYCPFSPQFSICQHALRISTCFPPPSSKNILLSQAGKTGPPKTTWKQDAVSGGRGLFLSNSFPFGQDKE